MVVFRFSSWTDAVTTCGHRTKQISTKMAKALLMADAVFFLKNRDNLGLDLRVDEGETSFSRLVVTGSYTMRFPRYEYWDPWAVVHLT